MDLGQGAHTFRFVWVNPLPSVGFKAGAVSLRDVQYAAAADLDRDGLISTEDIRALYASVSRSDFAQALTLSGTLYYADVPPGAKRFVRGTQVFPSDAAGRGVRIADKQFWIAADGTDPSRLRLAADHAADLNKDGNIDEADDAFLARALAAYQRDTAAPATDYTLYDRDQAILISQGAGLTGTEPMEEGGYSMGDDGMPNMEWNIHLDEAGDYRIGLAARSLELPVSRKSLENRRSTCCNRGSKTVFGGISSIARFPLQVAAPRQDPRLWPSDGAI